MSDSNREMHTFFKCPACNMNHPRDNWQTECREELRSQRDAALARAEKAEARVQALAWKTARLGTRSWPGLNPPSPPRKR